MRLVCSITDHIPQWRSPTGSAINFSGSSVALNSFPFQDRISVNPSGDLIILKFNEDDVGQYTCSYPGSGSETINLLMKSMYVFVSRNLKPVKKIYIDF